MLTQRIVIKVAAMAVLIKRADQAGERYQGKTRKPYTVRWTANGRQRERSFATRKDAADFKASVEHSTREGSYLDPRLASIRFADYLRGAVAARPVSDGTRERYFTILREHVEPWAASRTLRQVAGDREGLATLVNGTMGHLSRTYRQQTQYLVVGALDEAVTAGRLASHRLAGIKLSRDASAADGQRAGFVFPSHAEVSALAGALNGYGLAVWLMRGCGLRIREALGVHREDFSADGTSLRVCGQATVDGTRKVALKHRKPGEHRDVPVPAYVWERVKDLPAGPVLPGKAGAAYLTYNSVSKRFSAVARSLDLPQGFTPHSLRHAFVSALLARGVPITDVADWLGHRSIQETYGTYGHLVPSAAGRARSALDAEYGEWAGAAG